MANHVLSLEVPTVLNTCILTVMDTSVYTDLIPVVCETLAITVPGFNHSVELPVNSGFIQNITACDLGLQTADCGTSYVDIPDGIYIIKYSVSPNDQVYVEYNHLRISKALNLYNKVLCQVDVNACDPPFVIKEKLEALRLIFMYLQAAVSKVETCHEPQKGMSLYNYAMKLLKKMSCINC
jgi:hypothetical protein